MGKPDFTIYGATNPGIKRRNKANQDAIKIFQPTFFNHKPPMLALSDGMGGYGGGEIASEIAVTSMISNYQNAKIQNNNYISILDEGIKKAVDCVTARSKEEKSLELMGCTMAAAILTSQRVFITNVGDSRIYIISEDTIRQISFDHSLVAEQVRNGMITKAEARKSSQRNILTLSISGRRESIKPYLKEEPWNAGNYVLLCSDGLWGSVSDNQILTAVTELDPQKACLKLIQMANINQGPDNISVIIARNEGKTSSDKKEN